MPSGTSKDGTTIAYGTSGQGLAVILVDAATQRFPTVPTNRQE
jgi:hypothetical protein